MNKHPEHPPIGCSQHREFRDLDTRRLPSAPPRPGSAVPKALGPDPLLARIQQLQRPGLPHAQLHADRLRAIAELPIIDAEIALWLEELAGLIEDHADHGDIHA